MHKHINKDFLKIDTLMEVLACVCVCLRARLQKDFMLINGLWTESISNGFNGIRKSTEKLSIANMHSLDAKSGNTL